MILLHSQTGKKMVMFPKLLLCILSLADWLHYLKKKLLIFRDKEKT